MLEIRLLGPSDVVRCGVRDPAADAVQRQPKRLALLAYLCLATRGGAVRRDTVLALFWPELDQSRARAALLAEYTWDVRAARILAHLPQRGGAAA